MYNMITSTSVRCVFVVASFLVVVQTTCENQIVGPDCDFNCHCLIETEDCNGTTGACPSGCNHRWAGPACQHKNYATTSTPRQERQSNVANKLPAKYAIDMQESTCSLTKLNENPWWKVWIGRERRVRGLRFTTNNTDLLRGLVVYVGTTVTNAQQWYRAVPPDNKLQVCHDHGETTIVSPMDITCGSTLIGDLIIIRVTGRPAQISLCEVAVYGECEPGTYGASCLTRCGHCLNGSTSCDNINGSCPNGQCAAGWQGDTCDTECAAGYWGSACNSVCGQCNNGTCNHTNGHCPRNLCEPGYKYSAKCNEECEPGTYGASCLTRCGHCVNGSTTCDNINGSCPNRQCAAGWQGDRCDTECADGYWGSTCNSVCGHCNNGTCNHTNGHCPRSRCKPGYKYSTMCKEECEPGTYGASCLTRCGHCVNGSTTCDNTNGSCPNRQCAAGWQGDRCDTECVEGNWGSGCSSTCGKCYTSPCNHIDGRCPGGRCQLGYKATDMCKNECEAGTYGDNCQKDCGHCRDGQTTCATTNGYCRGSMCADGWKGNRCDQECSYGKWGSTCASECGECYNSTCHHINGTCPGNACKAGYTSEMCNVECVEGNWGSGCSSTCGKCYTSPCNHIDGRCPGGRCQLGYKATDLCKNECEAGTYGDNCQKDCGHCRDGQTTCSATNGYCRGSMCADGWKGDRCDQECSYGKWGSTCASECGECHNSTCHHINGTCPGNACKAGYTSEMCNVECSYGKWGSACYNECGECHNNTCHHINGTCPGNVCKAGYTSSEMCNEVCGDGFYGLNCQHECGECAGGTGCDSINGYCTVGCLSEWHGQLCKAYRASEVSMSSVAVRLGVAAAIVAAAAVIIISITIYRLKRSVNEDATLGRDSKPFSPAGGASNNGLYENATIVVDGPDTVVYLNNGPIQYANCDALRHQPPAQEFPAEVSLKSEEHRDNTCTSVHMKPASAVQLADLQQYICEHAEQDIFATEYAKLPVGLQSPTDAALLPSNRSKNRYKNIYPYDFNRVVLRLLEGKPNSDYTNASYINGYDRDDSYIASQGPTENNIKDFVRMIWEVRIEMIVMLTGCVERGVHKCKQYWPDNGEATFGDVTVYKVSEEVFADFTIRKFILSMGGEKRTIHHYQFTSWPDKEVPAEPYGLLRLHSAVRRTCSDVIQPTLVHCSAGVGRTGTYIAFDCLYDEGHSKGYISILPRVQELRRQRILMVQREKQYAFLHEMLYITLVSQFPVIAIDEFPMTYTRLCQFDSTTGKTKLAIFYQKMNDNELTLPDKKTEINDIKTDLFKTSKMAENMTKNRNHDVLASDMCRPFLSMHVDGCNNYINAVYLQTYRHSKGLIITQLPLPNTAVDFCRLVYQAGVELLVTFTDEDMAQEDTWLQDKTTEHGPFVMTATFTNEGTHFSRRDIDITYNNATKTIKQYIFTKSCHTGRTYVEALVALMSLVDEDHRKRHNDSPVVVQCLSGCDSSGVFCVLWNVLERMRFDREVAIPQTIMQARTRRKQLISNIEQFKVCHDVVLNYIENHSVYSNM